MLIFFVVLFMGACTSSGEMVSGKPVRPVAGNWDYSIESPEGLFTGKLIITDAETELNVSVMGEGQEAPIEAVDAGFDEETQTLSFAFENPDYGMLEVSLVLGDDGMDGILHAVRYGVDSPITATRAEQ